jgi:hypothetical protein
LTGERALDVCEITRNLEGDIDDGSMECDAQQFIPDLDAC